MLASNRPGTVGTYGYIGGNGNIGNVIPTMGTGSLLRPIMAFNVLNSSLSLQFTTSSLAASSISNNLIYNSVTINHQSGSINLGTNGFIAGTLTSTQNITTPNTQANIGNNIFTSNLATTLSHNSSSILYNGNIGAVTVTNNYTSSVSTAVDNITVSQNLFNGNSISLVVTGSNTSNRRIFNSNLISGRSNLINSNHSGSSAGHLVSTALLGDTLIVSASHTNTSQGGSVFVGRFNATGSLQESSQEAVFVVGTGTGDGNRRNALHIDNGNNTRITGSVSISGSLTVNGSSVVTGSVETNRNGLITTGSFGTLQSITGSVSVSGSFRVSGSITNFGGGGINNNTAYGDNALSANTTGTNNLAFGNNALQTNISGSFNLAVGSNALLNNKANNNMAVGASAMQNNQVGENNTAVGGSSLYNNIIGNHNLAIGRDTMYFNTSGSFNTAIGGQSLYTNVSGSGNVAIGYNAGKNETGDNNFYVNNVSTGNLNAERSGSLMWGTFNGTTSAQTLQINANTDIRYGIKVQGNVQFESGSNKTMGTVALNGANPGTATVSNSLVTATSLIFLTKQTNTNSGNGTVSVTSKGTGTFSITSDHNGDADTVAYQIINPI
jgi:hypothetical protein